jgi:hypothetical protein
MGRKRAPRDDLAEPDPLSVMFNGVKLVSAISSTFNVLRHVLQRDVAVRQVERIQGSISEMESQRGYIRLW